MRLTWVLASGIFLCACGARVVVDHEAAGGDGTGGPGTDTTGSGGAGAGWSECSTPSGFGICWDAVCPDGPPDCQWCLPTQGEYEGQAGLCVNDAWLDADWSWLHCRECPDGNACVQYVHELDWHCGDLELAQLFVKAGASSRVRYADFGAWTGGSLPEHEGCPAVAGVSLCGGPCGTCPLDRVCHGRSPEHPRSLCVPVEVTGGPQVRCERGGTLPCPKGSGCFVFAHEDDPEAQAVADGNGWCLPEAECLATAAGLPGGGFCELP